MKSTKVQTLGAVALHATTAYTDEATIIGLSSLNWVPSVLPCLAYGLCTDACAHAIA